MPVAVISMATGMTSAVMIAARMLPSSRNRTAMTRSAPSARFFATVPIVASTSCVRLSTVLTSMPGGRVRAISVMLRVDGGRDRAAVLADQHQGGADHDLLAVLAGRAGAQLAPDPHLGDVADATGTPPRVATTTSPISSMVSRRPSARTT